MKVDYLFSRNKKIGSRIIAWASSHEKLKLDKIPSHCAVLLNETWVVESTLSTGVRIAPYARWRQINEELYKIPCAQTSRSSYQVLQEATKVWNKSYDWLGILYFAFCFLMLIALDRPLPKENKWQKKGRYFCTEYVGILSGMSYSMTSPARLLCDILECIDEQR